MPSSCPLPARTVAIAAGLAAAALTDGLLAVTGVAGIAGVQVGVVASPLLAIAVPPAVRRMLVDNAGPALIVVGAAWTVAPFLDQHLTRAVVIDSAAGDLIHHLAGWPALLAGARLVPRPKRAVSS